MTDDRQPADDLVLPEPVRALVIAWASDTLDWLPVRDVPAALRPAARFTPTKRVRLAGAALGTSLATESTFRLRVAEFAANREPSLAEAVRAGEVPAAADPILVAALAYLSRPVGWRGHVDRVADALRVDAERDRAREHDEAVGRLRARLEEVREEARAEARRAEEKLDEVRAELAAARKRLREEVGTRRAAERARDTANQTLEEERRTGAEAKAAARAEIRRLRHRLKETEDTAEGARRAARDARTGDETRLWLLVETLSGALAGLRRELALPAPDERPADVVAAGLPDRDRPPAPGAAAPDPLMLDQILDLPMAHLIVDGYNVTKTGYGNLPLSTQRTRLISGLGALVARTGAEVTCVFDGAARLAVQPAAPRGVRVLFSEPDEIADDVIRRLVATEPDGRPIAVVTSDREIVTDVRKTGGYPIPSRVLLDRLERS